MEQLELNPYSATLLLASLIWLGGGNDWPAAEIPAALPGHATTTGVAFDLQDFIDQAINAGAKRIVVPPGRYRVAPRDRQHLRLRGLKDVDDVHRRFADRHQYARSVGRFTICPWRDAKSGFERAETCCRNQLHEMKRRQVVSAVAVVLLSAAACLVAAEKSLITPLSGDPSPPSAAGKLAPRPLYRDPPFDAPTDPVLCFNAEAKKWYMYYTARRATATNAPGVTWVHGSNIGMAESSDGGATWIYRGTAKIDYGKDQHPNDWRHACLEFGRLS